MMARSKYPSSSATPADSPGAESFIARPGATASSGLADKLQW
jgi:hypothetical protein